MSTMFRLYRVPLSGFAVGVKNDTDTGSQSTDASGEIPEINDLTFNTPVFNEVI